MADVRPFRAVTYDPAKVDLATVLSPPYDVINRAQQDAYYERDPHNAVRIVLSRGDGDQRYVAAAEDLHAWLADGVLRRDDQPAFYVHRHSFAAPGARPPMSRTGLVAAVRLEPWESGAVKPHEHTMPGPKEDRLKLLRATGADTEPIWVFHPDPAGELRRRLDAVTAAPPTLSARFEPVAADAAAALDAAETHELWRVDDPAAVREIAGTAGAVQLYIADGHHRYETALFHAEEVGGGPDDPSRFKVMLLSQADDPGLLLLPTHRLLWVDGQRLHAAFGAMVAQGWTSEDATGLDALMRRLATPAAPGRLGFGAYADGRFGYMESPVGADGPESNGPSLPAAVDTLDVARIHHDIFEPLLGIGPAELSAGTHVGYGREAAEVVARVDRGEYNFGVLLRPPTLAQVVAVADAGESMPQKSTYFWPKPASGLVMALQEPGGKP